MKKILANRKRWKQILLHVTWGGFLALVFMVGLTAIWYELYLKDRIYPRVTLAGMQVDYKTKDEAREIAGQAVSGYMQGLGGITLRHEGESYEIADFEQAVDYDIPGTIEGLFTTGREAALVMAWQQRLQRLTRTEKAELAVTIDEKWWEMSMATISARLTKPFVPESWEVESDAQGNLQVRVLPSVTGTAIREDQLKRQLTDALAHLTPLPTALPIETIASPLTAAELQKAEERGREYLTRTLLIRSEDASGAAEFSLEGADLIPFLRIGGGFNHEVIEDYLVETAESINREPVEAKFEFNESTQKVAVFSAPKDGYRVNTEASLERLVKGLEELESGTTSASLVLAGVVFKPTITLDKVNDLGIKELIGRGESTYRGSIATRVHNVALTAAKINGSLIKPGEVFSFNKAVGDISAATGFQQAYVIRNGRTELGDGGGVCQDSTTLFRAVLNAGLPIHERRAHSYRVGYYEQDAKPGLDATVYSPTTDFSFKNDTSAHILIQAKADSANRHLVIELYGTNDGRRAEILNHRVWDNTPPPPDVYVEDPTMKVGEVKQVDWKAAGAKAAFDYKVWRGDQLVIDKTFASTYKPWASVFLKGTLE